MDSRIPVKLANVHQVVTLTIPQDEAAVAVSRARIQEPGEPLQDQDQGAMCRGTLPAFHQHDGCSLFLNTRSDFIGMVRLRNSLEHLPHPKGKMKHHG